MKFYLTFLFAVIIIITKTLQANSINKWIPIGPDKASVLELIEDYNNSCTLYAATIGGLYKSTDGGKNWKIMYDENIQYPVCPITLTVVLDPKNSNIIYTAIHDLNCNGGLDTLNTWGGLYKSTDGGKTWKTMKKLWGLNALAVDYTNSNVLYAGCRSWGFVGGYGIYKSTDGGETFEIIGNSYGVEVYDMTLDAVDSNIIYVKTESLLFRSLDSGNTWEIIGGDYLGWISVDPAQTGILYTILSTWSDDYEDYIYKIYRSIDYGNTWIEITPIPPTPTAHYGKIAIDPDDSETIYITIRSDDETKDYIYKSINSGDNWEYKGFIYLPPVSGSSTIIVSKEEYIYLIGTHGIYKSIDDGVTWNKNIKGIYNATVEDIEFADSKIIYAKESYLTINKSTDDGLNWQIMNLPDNSSNWELTVHPSDANILYIGYYSKGIYKSTDGSNNWILTDYPHDYLYRKIIFNPHNPDTIYIGHYRSVDDGLNWEEFAFTPSREKIDIKLINYRNTNILYGIANYNHFYKTIDGGQTWVRKPPYDILYGLTGKLVIDPLSPDTLYYVFGIEFYKTTNGGDNWVKLGIPESDTPYSNANDFVVDHINNNTIYISTYIHGVYKSLDGGNSWSQMNNGLMHTSLNVLAINPYKLYCGTIYGGIYVYDLYNTGDIKLQDSLSVSKIVPNELSLSQNYPNPFNIETQINYQLPVDSRFVSLKIYNISGELVKVLVNQPQRAGYYQVLWNARDNSRRFVATGIYFYQLKTNSIVITKKMLILR